MRRFSLLLLLVAVAGIGYFVGARAKDEPAKEPRSLEVVPTPNALTALRRLARLETAQFSLERVIDLKDKQSRFFGMVEAKDAILLVAAGTVTAGIDFGALQEKQIEVNWSEKRITLTLPAAQVLSVHLDEQRTYVHTRATDKLATRRETLETEARREAERGFEQAAQSEHLLSIAESNAEKTVRSLLDSLGFERIELRFEAHGLSGERPGERGNL